jgi:hypothetical protein
MSINLAKFFSAGKGWKVIMYQKVAAIAIREIFHKIYFASNI